MDTCVICGTAYDPRWDESGKELLDYETHICYKCKKKIENGEIKVEEYDKEFLKETKPKEIIQQLKFPNYIFEIDGKDIGKVKVKYILYEQSMDIELSGINEFGAEASFSTTLEISLKRLNGFSKKPVDISKYVFDSETFLKRPNNKYTPMRIYFLKNNEEDMYNNLSSAWILKLDENKFLFKFCIPTENLFTYFEIDFNTTRK